MRQHYHSADVPIHLLKEASQEGNRANTKLDKINQKPKRIPKDETKSRHLENKKGKRKEDLA